MEQQIPNWMNDPSLSSVPQEKLQFLLRFKERTAGLDKKQMMPAVMQLLKDAKQNSLSFTKEEIDLIVHAIKSASSDVENNKIDEIIKKASGTK